RVAGGGDGRWGRGRGAGRARRRDAAATGSDDDGQAADQRQAKGTGAHATSSSIVVTTRPSLMARPPIQMDRSARPCRPTLARILPARDGAGKSFPPTRQPRG